MRCALSIARSAAMLALLGAAACTPQYVREDRTDRRPRELQVAQHAGGTHHVLHAEGTRWIQAFGHRVMTIDVTNGRELGRVDAVPFGEGGAVVDMAVHGDHAYVVSDHTSFIEIDVSDASEPRVVRTVPAAELGVDPRHVSFAADDVWVSGPDGVVRISDRVVFMKGKPVGRVVSTPAGPVAVAGRRLVTIPEGRYLGAATDLAPLPPGTGPEGGFSFALQGSNGATVGLMTAAFAETSHKAIPGVVRSVRVLDDRLFALNDRAIHAWRIEGTQLVDGEEIPLRGGRDIGVLRPNHYAVCGSFGRAMYRHRAEGKREADTFYNVDRQPGLLEVAISDGRRILAGGREGFWMWRVGSEPEVTDKTTELVTAVDPEVTAAWGSARILKEKDAAGNEVRRAVEIRHGPATDRYVPEGSHHVTCIALVDGDVWIGHDRGLDVLRRVEAAPELDERGRPKPPTDASRARAAAGVIEVRKAFRFEGPPLYVYPERIGGGAAVITLHGGFILLKPVAVGEAPVFEGRGDVQ
ncbi:MAG: hypothetical protein ACOYO7_00500 [Phycisphaerales bacterium]|jgi:hypothetical protein